MWRDLVWSFARSKMRTFPAQSPTASKESVIAAVALIHMWWRINMTRWFVTASHTKM
jgi:hypothetical protein